MLLLGYFTKLRGIRTAWEAFLIEILHDSSDGWFDKDT